MKKKLMFEISERLKQKAKLSARKHKMLYGDYSAEAYRVGVELKDFAWENNISTDDILCYLESCTNATVIQKALVLSDNHATTASPCQTTM